MVTGQRKRFAFASIGGLRFIHLSDIMYFKSDNTFAKAILCDGASISIHMALGMLEKQLRDHGFVRTHKCYIVNVDHIEHYTKANNSLLLSDQSRLPLSRTRRSAFLHAVSLPTPS